MRSDDIVARMARQQHGVVSRSQVRAAGLSAESLERRLAAGRLRRVGWHVYALAGAPTTWEQLAMAACLDLGPPVVLSHGSAGRLWQVHEHSEQLVEVTVPHHRSGRRATKRVTVHRTRHPCPTEPTLIKGLPVTDIGQTLLDLAGTVDANSLVAAVENALSRRLLSPEQLVRVLDRLSAGGRRGSGTVRRAVTPWLGGPRMDSVAESAFRRLIGESGLPDPVAQFEVDAGHGHVFYLDFAWPDEMVALEVDGFRWHANPRAAANDSRRANRLAALGWRLVRASPAELRDGAREVLDALRRYLLSSA